MTEHHPSPEQSTYAYPRDEVLHRMAIDGWAVNNHDDIASLTYENWHVLPQCLADMLGSREEVRELLV